MRKTFVVGKLTPSTARILLVENDGRPTPALLEMLRMTTRAEAQRDRLPDPLTLH
jgi:hypothetical protein